MSGKTLNTRIQNKRGTTAEWAAGSAPNFVPKDGEIVAYTDVHRIKIGDGTTKVSALPFVDKVRDVTLGGESMVNANGVVELQPTEMTDGCIPVWNNTEKIFIDSYCHNTADGLQVEGSIGMYSYEYTLDINVQDGSFSYSDDGQNTIKKYTLPITKNSGTLALTSDIPSASDFVTTNTEQTITGSKTFTSTTTYTGGITNKRSSTGRFFDCYSSASGATASTIFGVYLNNAGTSSVNPIGTVNIGSAGTQCAIELAGSAGTSGQVIISQGGFKTPKWGEVVTIDTAQNITGTKTFNNIDVTGKIALADCNINFQNADGALQTLGIGSGLSSSAVTYFTLPSIEDDTTYELGTAMYCHYITAFTSGGSANFQVFCNRQTKFTSLSELYSSIMTLQDDTAVYIPATGVFYSSTFANVQIVESVCFRSNSIYVGTHYISKGTSSETQTATSIMDRSIYACNRTR